MPICTTIETITPDMAKSYIKSGMRNRKVKPKAVDALARDMEHDKFILTHQGIAFDEDGKMIDGQHRMFGILKANKPVNMMVTRGLPRDAILATDRGVSRSIGDVVRIMNGTEVASKTSKASEDQKILSALSQIVSCNYKSVKITTDDMLKLLSVFSGEVTRIYESVLAKAYARKNRAPVIAAAIAAMKCGVELDIISKFFAVFNKDDVSGCYEYNCQAPLNWRRQIDDARIKRVSIDSRKLYFGTQNAIWHFANNTDSSRVVVPKALRYDVSDYVKRVFES